MRIYHIVSAAVVVAAALSCTKFDDLQSQLDKQKEALEEQAKELEEANAHFNLPCGIVMLSTKFEERMKGDTCDMYVRVNPSDYVLEKENLELWASHSLFTCYTDGEQPEEGYKPVFDTKAKSEFSLVDIAPSDYGGGEGVWKIRYAISGEGNYFDDATVFVVAKANDNEGKERSVCSATPCQVFVVPSLWEGIHIDTTPQNLYARKTNGGMEKGTAKAYIVGLWSNFYISDTQGYRIYNRADVTPESVPDTLYSTLNNEYYQNYGFVTVTPDLETEYWKGRIALEDKQDAIETPGAVISLNRKGVRTEKADLVFEYKVFYGGEAVETPAYSIVNDDIYNLSRDFDYTAARTRSGYDEFHKMWFSGTSKSELAIKCGIIATDTKDKLSINLSFPSAVTAGCKSGWIYANTYSIKKGQAPDGSAADLPEDFDPAIQFYYIKHTHTITE